MRWHIEFGRFSVKLKWATSIIAHSKRFKFLSRDNTTNREIDVIITRRCKNKNENVNENECECCVRPKDTETIDN